VVPFNFFRRVEPLGFSPGWPAIESHNTVKEHFHYIRLVYLLHPIVSFLAPIPWSLEGQLLWLLGPFFHTLGLRVLFPVYQRLRGHCSFQDGPPIVPPTSLVSGVRFKSSTACVFTCFLDSAARLPPFVDSGKECSSEQLGFLPPQLQADYSLKASSSHNPLFSAPTVL